VPHSSNAPNGEGVSGIFRRMPLISYRPPRKLLSFVCHISSSPCSSYQAMQCGRVNAQSSNCDVPDAEAEVHRLGENHTLGPIEQDGFIAVGML
jgi:hypothetical protein